MKRQRIKGFALITALIFLVVLTLVAVIATRSAGLELRMSANHAQATEAFEASEAPRQVAVRLLQVLGDNLASGWPQSIGGPTEDALFAYPLPAALQILDASGKPGGTPLNWFEIPEASFKPERFTPKARYSQTLQLPGSTAVKIAAEIDVQLMHKSFRPGCEMSGAGYDGVSSKGCLDYFFLVSSRGQDASSGAFAETASVFRYVPKL